MYKELLRSIEEVGIYPLISLVLFFVFFLVMLFWVLKIDKKFLKRMEELPLDNKYDGIS